MNKEKIQILIPCGGPSALDFLDILTYSIELLASNKYDIEYLIGLNLPTPSKPEVENLFKNKVFPSQIYTSEDNKLLENTQESSSEKHGKNMQALLSYANSKYAIICDVDTAVLCKDWDDILINELEGNKIIIGSHYRKSVRTGIYAKYSNFPNQFFSLFKVKEFKQTVKCLIPSLKNVKVNEDNIKIYGPPVGRTISLDTFHNVPEYLISAGYEGICLDTVSREFPTSKFVKKYSISGDEFMFKGETIAVHHGRAWSRGIDLTWKNEVLKWLEKSK